jgi:proline iminopeptidase
MPFKLVLTLLMGGLVVAAALAIYHWSTGPLYRPGALRRAALTDPLDPPAQPDPGFFQVTPSVRLRHFEEGRGDPLLVLHGGPGFPPAAPWKAGALLQDRWRLIYYHQRGAGLSSRPVDRLPAIGRFRQVKLLDETLGLGAQIADVERIRRILGREKLTLVGHSFGALLAALYAAEFPEQVAALVLVAPANLAVLPVDPRDDLYKTVGARLPAASQPAYQAYVRELFDFSTLFTRDEAGLADLFGRFKPFYAAAVGAGDAEVGAAPGAPGGGWMPLAVFLSMGRHHDYRAALAQVKAPVLVIHGERDLQLEATSRAFAALFPASQVEVIAGAGHFPFDQAPGAFAAAVRRFLVQNR